MKAVRGFLAGAELVPEQDVFFFRVGCKEQGRQLDSKVGIGKKRKSLLFLWRESCCIEV